MLRGFYSYGTPTNRGLERKIGMVKEATRNTVKNTVAMEREKGERES